MRWRFWPGYLRALQLRNTSSPLAVSTWSLCRNSLWLRAMRGRISFIFSFRQMLSMQSVLTLNLLVSLLRIHWHRPACSPTCSTILLNTRSWMNTFPCPAGLAFSLSYTLDSALVMRVVGCSSPKMSSSPESSESLLPPSSPESSEQNMSLSSASSACISSSSLSILVMQPKSTQLVTCFSWYSDQMLLSDSFSSFMAWFPLVWGGLGGLGGAFSPSSSSFFFWLKWALKNYTSCFFSSSFLLTQLSPILSTTLSIKEVSMLLLSMFGSKSSSEFQSGSSSLYASCSFLCCRLSKYLRALTITNQLSVSFRSFSGARDSRVNILGCFWMRAATAGVGCQVGAQASISWRAISLCLCVFSAYFLRSGGFLGSRSLLLPELSLKCLYLTNTFSCFIPLIQQVASQIHSQSLGHLRVHCLNACIALQFNPVMNPMQEKMEKKRALQSQKDQLMHLKRMLRLEEAKKKHLSGLIEKQLQELNTQELMKFYQEVCQAAQQDTIK